jgi:hypothetical protein
MSDIAKRITDYLMAGGLHNPELANHDAVRDLLIDARAEVDRLRKGCKRLEWLVENEATVVHGLAENGQPDGFFAVSVGPHIVTGWHDNYADAIDQTMVLDKDAS